jgi:signal transduction histidine kinase
MAQATAMTIPRPETAKNASSDIIYDKLMYTMGTLVYWIGLGGIIGYALDWSWLLSWLPLDMPAMRAPSALGLFFLGIAIKTIMISTPFPKMPNWQRPVRHMSLFIPTMISLYVVHLYLQHAEFNIMSILIHNFHEIVPSFLENFILLQICFALWMFLRFKHSEAAVVYGVNIPTLIVLCLVLFALVGYWQDIPVLFSFKLSLPTAIAYLFASVAILIGSIPFGGLLSPIVSPSTFNRILAYMSLIMGFGVLMVGAHAIARFEDYIMDYTNLAPRLELYRLYIDAEFVTTVQAILVTTLSLRTLHYFNKSAFYARQEALALQQVAAAKENEKLRSTFISTLTHDLRTPLIAQNRVLEVLQKQPKIKEDIELGPLITGFLQNNDHLLKMVNILLETYQYEDGKIKLNTEAVSLHQLVNDSFSELASLAKSHNITLENAMPADLPMAHADFYQFKRVFLNLLGNALENIPYGRHIRVHAQPLEGVIQVKVEDNGPGIAPDILPYLFDRYYTGHSTRQKIGSGLGLFICKMIIDLHGGIIKAESEVGKGTCFTFTLPIHTDSEDNE